MADIHTVQLKCYETMGVPNTVATCSCGDKKVFYPMQAKKDGFVDDWLAARAWKKEHEAT